MLAQAREAMAGFQLHRMFEAVWSVVADANRYFAAQEPWALRKSDFARMETVLYVTAEVIRQVAILAQPAMPVSAAKLLDALAIPRISVTLLPSDAASIGHGDSRATARLSPLCRARRRLKPWPSLTAIASRFQGF